MAAKLGRLFLTAAMGPVAYAGRCIMARKVKAGLDELTAESLMGAVDRGVGTVAKEVGLPASYVGQLLPTAELQTLINRIVQHQQTATEQWELHTSHIGGLLDGVADLTVDGRAPDTSLCLLRLSRKMKMDSAVATPLRELSEDLDRWLDLLQRCRSLIDDGHSLKEAYQRRRMLQGIALGLGFLVLTLLGAVGLQYWQARGRVEAVLAQAEACSVEQIDEDDLGKASGEQEQRVKDMRERCEAEREEARKKAEAERLRKEKEAERKRLIEERKKSCAALAKAIEQRTITEPALKADPKRSALIKRLVIQKLSSEDITGSPELPCEGTEVEKAVRIAYARGVLAASGLWLGKLRLSEMAFESMVEHKATLPEKDVLVLTWASEDKAKKAVRGGQKDAIANAAQLCQLAEKLALPTREDCQIALALAAKQ